MPGARLHVLRREVKDALPFRGRGSWHLFVIGLLLVGMGRPAVAQEQRCFTAEVFVSDAVSNERCDEAVSWIENYATKGGLRVYRQDATSDEKAAERFERVRKHFRLSETSVPLVYVAGQAFVAPTTSDQFERRFRDALTMTVFVRNGCPRCARAKSFLPSVQRRYPALRLVYREITTDRYASSDLEKLSRTYGQRAVSVPVFHFCQQMVVGFDREETSGKSLLQKLDYWTHRCRQDDVSFLESATLPEQVGGETCPCVSPVRVMTGSLFGAPWALQQVSTLLQVSNEADEADDTSEFEDELPPLPPPPPGPPPPPLDGDPSDLEGGAPPSLPPPPTSPMEESEMIRLPVFGEVDASRVGLPLFTIAVGLVDGFNPCAMWVLLFLLSILVNLKDRWKILAVAGTFVLISGLAYFAFMAAWLNVFRWVGLLRPVQIALGLLAIFVGGVHIKDFFAFKHGLSLSIPESAKPGIYARVRQIVNAENLFGAIVGASILAVMVNIVELLCTSGLPALYTSILAMQQLPVWHEYLYLALYNLAYMFDDSLMVGVVVITLGRHKLQETQGRWLKLVSGLVIFVLGVIMLVRPELLL